MPRRRPVSRRHQAIEPKTDSARSGYGDGSGSCCLRRPAGGSCGSSRVNRERAGRGTPRPSSPALSARAGRLVVVDERGGGGLVEAGLLAAASTWSAETKSMPDPTATPTCSETCGADPRIVLDGGDECAGQAGQHDRADEGHAEGRAELLAGELQPAGLAAARFVDRGLDHVAELGDHQAHPDAEHAHADGEPGVRERRAGSSRAGSARRRWSRPVRSGRSCAPGSGSDSLAPSPAARNMVIEIGSILMPGLEGVESEHELQVQRDDEEDAHQDQVLAEQPDDSGPHRWDPAAATGGRAGRAPVASRWRCHVDERPQQDAPGADDEQRHRRSRTASIGRVLGLDPAPGARLEHAEHDQAQTGGRQHRADDVELRLRAGPQRVLHLAES